MDVVQELVAAGARAVFVAVRDPSRRAVVRFRSLSLFCFLFLSFKRENCG